MGPAEPYRGIRRCAPAPDCRIGSGARNAEAGVAAGGWAGSFRGGHRGAHAFGLGNSYPLNRTGIYFLPLAVFVLLALAESGPRLSARAAHALAGLLIAIFTSEFNVRKFLVWGIRSPHAHHGGIHRGAPSAAFGCRTGTGGRLLGVRTGSLFLRVQESLDLDGTAPHAPAGGGVRVLSVVRCRSYGEKLGLRDVNRGTVSGSVLAEPR